MTDVGVLPTNEPLISISAAVSFDATVTVAWSPGFIAVGGGWTIVADMGMMDGCLYAMVVTAGCGAAATEGGACGGALSV